MLTIVFILEYLDIKWIYLYLYLNTIFNVFLQKCQQRTYIFFFFY